MFMDKKIQQHKAVSTSSIKLNLDGVPIKIPSRVFFFFFKKHEKKTIYRKAKSLEFFFKETVKKTYMGKFIGKNS